MAFPLMPIPIIPAAAAAGGEVSATLVAGFYDAFGFTGYFNQGPDVFGSLTPSSWVLPDFLIGALVSVSTGELVLKVDGFWGAYPPNSGWEVMEIDGPSGTFTFSRTSAYFEYDTWIWSGTPNIFTDGATYTVTIS